jgi:hypothetical protein
LFCQAFGERIFFFLKGILQWRSGSTRKYPQAQAQGYRV